MTERMRNPANGCTGLVLLCLAVPTQGHAQGFGGSLAATTDYVFRGVSQTRGEAAAQADVHYRGHAGWFVGAWGSNVDTLSADGGDFELNGYLGADWSLGTDWTLRATYVHYWYPGADRGWGYDYDNVLVAIAHRDRLSLELGWSPNMVSATRYGYEHRGHAWSGEVTWRQPLRGGFSVALGAGYYGLEDLFEESYAAWSATLSYAWRTFEVDLGRYGADATARELYGRESAGDRWALSAVWSF
jgi:uncharacterized protein (TIGR02001 family)